MYNTRLLFAEYRLSILASFFGDKDIKGGRGKHVLCEVFRRLSFFFGSFFVRSSRTFRYHAENTWLTRVVLVILFKRFQECVRTINKWFRMQIII